MKKKHINTSAITNELAGGASLFFSKEVSPPPVAVKPAQATFHKESHLPPKEEKNEANHEVMTSLLHEINLRVWRDMIENTETHNSSLRLTNEENYAVEDVVNELKRSLKIKTSLNEVARLGLLYIIQDFKTNREKSLIYKVKKS